ncbi:MAG: polysaccharide biosynthesis tyrosine autokinase [Planctomycetia bacterium]|nr:polysaccharide biosynthesis tyrosine autokinase [Planctomycetia bacterium]
MESNYEQLPAESRQPSEGRLVPQKTKKTDLFTVKKQPDIITHGIRPIDLVYSLRRRWPLGLGLGLVMAGITILIAWFVIPVTYRTHVWLRVAKERPSVIFRTKSESNYLNDRNAQATLIRSRIVLDTALQQPGIAQLDCLKNEKDKVDWLIQNLQVGYLGGTEILQIAISGKNPEDLVKILLAVRSAYMDQIVAQDRNMDVRRRMTLENAYNNTGKLIKRKEVQYNNLADNLGTPDSQTARYANIYALESVSTLRSQVNQLRAQISGLDRKIAILEKRKSAVMPAEQELVIEEAPEEKRKKAAMHLMIAYLHQDPEISRLNMQLSQLDATIKEQSKRAKNPEKHPSVVRLRNMYKECQDALQQRYNVLKPIVQERVESDLVNNVNAKIPQTLEERLQAEIDLATMDKEVLQEELDSRLQAYNAAVDNVQKYSQGSTELDNFRVELERMKKMYYQMGNQLDEWTIEAQAAARVQPINEPELPKKSNIQQKIQMMGILGIVSFLGTVVAVGGFDFLGRRVNHADELSFGLGVQVMGDLPLISRGIHRHKVSQSIQGLLMESIDNIRTALLHRAETENMSAILITSSLEKEGKTTVSSQLAASMARTGRRVILLDADLRRPSSHRMFDRPLNPGLAEYLRGRASLDEVITTTRVENLWIIPAGTPHPEAIISLAQGGMTEPMRLLREQFDFVIVDSGPVLTDADVLVIGRLCDGVVLSVLRDVSRLPWVYEACERIRMVEIPLIGVVLNGVSFGKYRPYYSSYTIEVQSSKTKQLK